MNYENGSIILPKSALIKNRLELSGKKNLVEINLGTKNDSGFKDAHTKNDRLRSLQHPKFSRWC